MPLYHDQLGRAVSIPATPRRIISVVPSQTELLFYLGLDENIIGITKFCTHPVGKVKNKTQVGGTKQLNIPLIKTLQPDLIIANKEENERAQIEELMEFCPVWISDINDLQGALSMIESLGQIGGRISGAKTLSIAISKQFSLLSQAHLNQRVAYLIWRKPYMVAGNNTFIDNMLQQCGLVNAFQQPRYPEISAEGLAAATPDIVFLSSEPYPFREKHIKEFKAILPNARIVLVDGEMFSWYGSRLLLAPRYFSSVVEALSH